MSSENGRLCSDSSCSQENGFQTVEEVSNFLLERTKVRPKIGIICGSGLGGLADLLQNCDSFPYGDIPNFPKSTVSGHAGKLVFGYLQGIPTVCMQGRFHFYEGHSMSKCVLPVRVMKLLGVVTVVVTNAAGAVNTDYNVGDFMIIKDHINFPGFAGFSPLFGVNDDRLGTRFPAMNDAYDRKFRDEAKKIAKELGMSTYLREGVYVMLGGPTYETVAEVRAVRILGGDAVGMSTVHEVVAARHCRLRVFGLSLITNKCIDEYETTQIANHKEVLETAENRKLHLEKFITRLLPSLLK